MAISAGGHIIETGDHTDPKVSKNHAETLIRHEESIGDLDGRLEDFGKDMNGIGARITELCKKIDGLRTAISNLDEEKSSAQSLMRDRLNKLEWELNQCNKRWEDFDKVKDVHEQRWFEVLKPVFTLIVMGLLVIGGIIAGAKFLDTLDSIKKDEPATAKILQEILQEVKKDYGQDGLLRNGQNPVGPSHLAPKP